MQLKKLLFILLMHLSFVQAAKAQLVKIKFINNCPDVSVPGIDIYVNGVLAVDDLNFRTGTAFFDYAVMPPNKMEIGIAPSSKPFITDTFLSVSLTVNPANPNIMIINGVKSTTGYNPYKKATLDVYANGRTTANTPGNTDYLIANGSTDMTTFDVKTGLTQIADDISYQGFATDYATIFTQDFKLRLTNASQSKIINTYNADFLSKGRNDEAVVIVASGFVDPASNSNGAAFGLYVAGPAAGPLVPLSTTTPESIARAQFINNSSDATSDTVDVYIDGNLKFDDWPLHNATPFEDYLAGVNMSIAVAPQNSVDVSEAFYTSPVSLETGKKYLFIANGNKTTATHTPPLPYVIHSTKIAQEDAAASGNTDLLFAQGSTDADPYEVKYNGSTLATGIAYGPPPGPYYAQATNDILLNIAVGTNIAQYNANLNTWGLQGKAATIVSSGYVKPASNAKGPELSFWLASPTGGTMQKLIPVVSVGKTNTLSKQFSLSPNPAQTTMHITAPANMQITTADVLDVTGKVVLSNVEITNNNINIATLNSGVYILHTMVNTEAVNIRFVKQ